ncbi:MAG: RnfABCDGE type electron transport complex subunit D [Bryobacteraceae bacterium]
MSVVATPEIQLRTSPHLHANRSVQTIMRHVVYAMLPLCAWGIWTFGLSAAAVIVTTTAACIAGEHLLCRLAGRPSSVGDWSIVITGILLGLILPPGFPLWMAAVGGFVAVGLGKMLFGGLGFNVFNPALVGRAFLQAAFPSAITTYTPALTPDRFASFIPTTFTIPLLQPPDIVSGATPLMARKFEHTATEALPLLFGQVSGSIGETSALLILLCGLYLIARNFMDWRIPAAMLGAAFLSGGAFHLADSARYPDPVFLLLSGGLMLGAMFMATDMVASPVTPLGVWIYGAVMGLITIVIRLKGGLPEGVMYAILLGNALSPAIDNFTQPRVYGTARKGAAR